MDYPIYTGLLFTFAPVQFYTVYLLTGCNLGDRFENMKLASRLVQLLIGSLQSASDIYSTKAWGITDQPDFLNQVLCIRTSKSPEDIMQTILVIENQLGRVRDKKWTARTMDIDILYYDDLIVKSAELKIPHPHMSRRRFVLAPLQQIAPDFMHPLLNKSTTELLDACTDPLCAERLETKYEV